MDSQKVKPTIILKGPGFNPRLLLILLGVALVGAAMVLYPRFATQGQKTSPAQTPPPAPIQTELIEGKAVSFKDNLLTLKKDNGQEVQIKIASQTTVLKQKWFDASSMGTVPAEVKAGDNLSVQATKNSPGDQEAVSVVILVEKPASESAKTKK